VSVSLCVCLSVVCLFLVSVDKGIVTVISDKVTKFEGIEFDKVFEIFINNELKRIEELQLMRSELCELWEENFYK